MICPKCEFIPRLKAKPGDPCWACSTPLVKNLDRKPKTDHCDPSISTELLIAKVAKIEKAIVEVCECLMLESMRMPSFTKRRIKKLHKAYEQFSEEGN